MKVLVTGGAGFIGHHLVSALVARGDEVVVIDSLITGSRERLEPFQGHAELVEADIRDGDALDRHLRGVETMFHLAALPSVQRSVIDPGLTNDINVNGTVHVMEHAASAGVRRVVVSGSSSVYGSGPGLPRREDQTPNPQSPYAVSKLAAEHYAAALGQLRGVQVIVLRYFNVFGPGQDPKSEYAAVVPRFVTSILRDERPTIHGDGKQSRDFTYVDNVVQANLLAGGSATVSEGTFNVGAGERYTLLDLIDAIGRVTGSTAEPIFGPPRAGDVRDSQADISRAVSILGYSPTVGFHEGIARTVDSYRRDLGL
jgi:UDP-glucose 4-epimerase